jgi:hypothetical protein
MLSLSWPRGFAVKIAAPPPIAPQDKIRLPAGLALSKYYQGFTGPGRLRCAPSISAIGMAHRRAWQWNFDDPPKHSRPD